MSVEWLINFEKRSRPIFIGGFLKDDILACVETFEISYKVMISWGILVSLRGFFLKNIFLHVEMFEFP
jgi:hypothetical protein